MSQGLALILLPPIGTRLIDSVPPASMTSAEPERTRSAAMAMDCNPYEQKRLMVMPETSTGNPARRLAMRATFIPCSASGIAQPITTSSISLGSSVGTFSSAPLMAMAARSSGRVKASVPLGALPTAVRTLLTMTASLMFYLDEKNLPPRREGRQETLNHRALFASCQSHPGAAFEVVNDG